MPTIAEMGEVASGLSIPQLFNAEYAAFVNYMQKLSAMGKDAYKILESVVEMWVDEYMPGAEDTKTVQSNVNSAYECAKSGNQVVTPVVSNNTLPQGGSNGEPKKKEIKVLSDSDSSTVRDFLTSFRNSTLKEGILKAFRWMAENWKWLALASAGGILIYKFWSTLGVTFMRIIHATLHFIAEVGRYVGRLFTFKSKPNKAGQVSKDSTLTFSGKMIDPNSTSQVVNAVKSYRRAASTLGLNPDMGALVAFLEAYRSLEESNISLGDLEYVQRLVVSG